MKSSNIRVVCVAVAFLAGSAFAQAPKTAPAGATPAPAAGKTEAPTAGTTAPAAMSDAQIAAIALAAGNVDIEAGKLAKSKSKSKEVKEFAALMVKDHTAVNKQATDLAKKLKLKPEENDTSKALKTGGETNRANLKKLKGAEFDKAYIDNEVTYHETVLSAVDNTLIPNAQNADLKALLEKARPVFAEHLEHAKKIQSSMGTGGSPGEK